VPVLPQTADLLIPGSPGNPFDLWTDSVPLLAQTRAAGDYLLSLVHAVGPAGWLSGAVVLAVALETVRYRRESQRRTRAGWPDVLPPSELA
jgi:hypothetical protein